MDEWANFDPHNKRKDVHPVLLRKLLKVLQAMEIIGYRMRLTDGARTLAEQQTLYAQGRTAPGAIVTHADGIAIDKGGQGVSNHQLKEDGYGHAVDCCFLDMNGVPTWQATYPWRAYIENAKAAGLLAGGDWPAPKTDQPHLELPRVI